jgi:hypothetical protein
MTQTLLFLPEVEDDANGFEGKLNGYCLWKSPGGGLVSGDQIF